VAGDQKAEGRRQNAECYSGLNFSGFAITLPNILPTSSYPAINAMSGCYSGLNFSGFAIMLPNILPTSSYPAVNAL
jgi:hypothetical protein